MIKVYKIIDGTQKVDQELLFPLSHNTRTKGKSIKLNSGKFKTGKKKYLFKHEIKLWNSLPQEAVETKNLTRFKMELDIYMDKRNVQSYKKMTKILEGILNLVLQVLNQSLTLRD